MLLSTGDSKKLSGALLACLPTCTDKEVNGWWTQRVSSRRLKRAARSDADTDERDD